MEILIETLEKLKCKTLKFLSLQKQRSFNHFVGGFFAFKREILNINWFNYPDHFISLSVKNIYPI